MERLAASIKLTKELQKLPCKVSIGPVVHPSPQGLSLHLYDENGYEDADDLSMFRIEDTYIPALKCSDWKKNFVCVCRSCEEVLADDPSRFVEVLKEKGTYV